MPEYSWPDIAETLRLDELLEALEINIVPATTRGWQNTPCPLPSHTGGDSNPSFGVNEESMSFNCFTCDERGNLAKLAAVLRDVSYEEALEWTAEFSDVESDDDSAQLLRQVDRWFEEPDLTRQRKFELPFFHPEALGDLPYAPLELLQKWGIRHSGTARTFGIRYDERRKRGTYEGPALVIPHRFGGDLVGWQERWLDWRTEGFPDWIPKYTNTSDFPRQETLYNYDRALALSEPTVAVESAPTIWRLFELGYTGVATFGSMVSLTQKRYLSHFDVLVLAYDGDAIKTTKALGDELEFTTVYSIAPLADRKADLADLEDDQIVSIIDEARYVA